MARPVDGQISIHGTELDLSDDAQASKLGRVFRTTTRTGGFDENDADARRMRIELDAIRARFPDHA